MSEEILKAVDQAQAVIAAVYVVPTAGKAMQGANGPTNSVALNDASGTLLQAILDHAAAENRGRGHGESVCGAGFSCDTELSLYFFQCRHFGNQRGQSSFWRDRHSWPLAGQHSQHRSTRRRHRARGTNRRGRTATCAYSQRLNGNSRLAFALVAFGALLALPGCNVNVKKDSEGQEKKVDIETPMGRCTSPRTPTCATLASRFIPARAARSMATTTTTTTPTSIFPAVCSA